ENAMVACPEKLWSDRSRKPEFWYIIFHTLFWLDFNLSASPEGFKPPAPFGLEEMDAAGIIPERAYTKDELQTYLEYCRKKCRARIEALTDEEAQKRWKFGSVDLNIAELLLYNMRHVQHHAAQLNLILRQTIDSAPRWVFKAKN
ncbi:MAG TPA: DinB family protein, partial [Terriglobales bacterium]|nr:DinB family protein [Terriglobales bacterium]